MEALLFQFAKKNSFVLYKDLQIGERYKIDYFLYKIGYRPIFINYIEQDCLFKRKWLSIPDNQELDMRPQADLIYGSSIFCSQNFKKLNSGQDLAKNFLLIPQRSIAWWNKENPPFAKLDILVKQDCKLYEFEKRFLNKHDKVKLDYNILNDVTHADLIYMPEEYRNDRGLHESSSVPVGSNIVQNPIRSSEKSLREIALERDERKRQENINNFYYQYPFSINNPFYLPNKSFAGYETIEASAQDFIESRLDEDLENIIYLNKEILTNNSNAENWVYAYNGLELIKNILLGPKETRGNNRGKNRLKLPCGRDFSPEKGYYNITKAYLRKYVYNNDVIARNIIALFEENKDKAANNIINNKIGIVLHSSKNRIALNEEKKKKQFEIIITEISKIHNLFYEIIG